MIVRENVNSSVKVFTESTNSHDYIVYYAKIDVEWNLSFKLHKHVCAIKKKGATIRDRENLNPFFNFSEKKQ